MRKSSLLALGALGVVLLALVLWLGSTESGRESPGDEDGIAPLVGSEDRSRSTPGEGALGHPERGALLARSDPAPQIRTRTGGSLAIAGIVRSPEGAPVANAEVGAYRGDAAISIGRLIQEIDRPPEPLARTRSDLLGRFRLEGLAPGRVRLRAAASGYAPAELRRVRLSAAGSTHPLELYLTAGFAVDVLLRDRSHQPMARQHLVLLRELDEEELRFSDHRQTTDAAGAARFDALPVGKYMLALVRPARAILILRKDMRLERAQRIEVELIPTGALAGRVSDPEGRALPGVRLALVTDGNRTPAAITTTTGADGSYHIEGLPPEKIGMFSAHLAGYGSYPATQSGILEKKLGPIAPDKVLRHDIVLSPGRLVVGRILDATDDQPIPGATIRFLPSADFFGDGAQGATSDAQGRYQLAGITPGRNLLQVEAPGYWTLRGLRFPPVLVSDRIESEKARFVVEVPAGGDRFEHDLALLPAAGIDGIVLDPHGAPVPAATVVLWEGKNRQRRPCAVETATDDEGLFAITPLPPGRPLRLEARAPGFLPALSEILRLKPAEIRAGLVLKLGYGATLRGRLSTADGGPVVGAQLALRSLTRLPGRGFHEQHIAADAHGAFRFENLPAWEYGLRAQHPGYLPRSIEPIDLRDGEQRSDLVLELRPGLPLEGQVLAPDGAPVAGAAVKLAIRDTDQGPEQPPHFEFRMKTDARGRFRFETVLDAPGVLEVRHDRYIEKRLGGVRPGAPLLIHLEPGMHIAGRVLSEGGQPLKGIWMRLSRVDFQRRTASDDQGRFEFPSLMPGHYDLAIAARTCQERNLLPLRKEEVPAGTRDLVLQPVRGEIISGRVVGSDGAPIRSCHVFAWRPDFRGQPLASSLSDKTGAFALRGLAPGTVVVEVRPERTGLANLRRPAVSTGSRALLLTLEAGREITGIVVDAAGRPLAGVGVNAVPADNPRTQRSEAWCRSDAAGRFKLIGLCDRSYHIHAWGQVADGRIHGSARDVRGGAADLRITALVQSR